jgi:hypothetical protein
MIMALVRNDVRRNERKRAMECGDGVVSEIILHNFATNEKLKIARGFVVRRVSRRDLAREIKQPYAVLL